jgi:apolipoprotein D and lipocalin family protein
MKRRYIILMLLGVTAAVGCQTPPPMPTVAAVDLPRFMGRWYVVANIPTFVEKGAHNPVEAYRLNDDGTIATTFTFNKDRFDGPLKTYTPKAFVKEGTSNAVWGMQFFWPIKAEYRIVYLNADYTQTVIGRSKRDYLWIMARQPTIPPEDYKRIIDLVTSLGYDPGRIETPPHAKP